MASSIVAALLTLIVLAHPPAGSSSGWTSFRGPNGSGVAEASELPDVLGPEANVAWRTPLAPGFSSPVLTDAWVYVTSVDGTRLLTSCISRETGELRWRRECPEELPEPSKGPNSPAAPTPVTDGTNVYSFFGSFGLISYDPAGEERWTRRLGPFRAPYGMGSSPILVGDALILLCDHDGGSYLLALHKDSGELIWRTERPGITHGFSTPVVHRPAEGPAELIVSGSYEVAGYSLESGEKLWWLTGMAWQAKTLPLVHEGTLFVHSWMAAPSDFGISKVTQPFEEALVLYDTDESGDISKEEASGLGLEQLWFLFDMNGDGVLDGEEWSYFVARGSAQNGLYAVRLGGRGDITADSVLWTHRRSLPNFPSPLLYDGVLYLLKEGGILTALDPATGEALQTGRIEGALDPYYASPVAADGRIFAASHSGRLAVLAAGAKWKLLSVADLGEEIWATPAIAGSQVFVRTQEALYCFEKLPG